MAIVINNDSIFIVFIGILISTIVYQSAMLTKIYKHIYNIENRLNNLEEKIE
jgi:hypothetical protein